PSLVIEILKEASCEINGGAEVSMNEAFLEEEPKATNTGEVKFSSKNEKNPKNKVSSTNNSDSSISKPRLSPKPIKPPNSSAIGSSSKKLLSSNPREELGNNQINIGDTKDPGDLDTPRDLLEINAAWSVSLVVQEGTIHRASFKNFAFDSQILDLFARFKGIFSRQLWIEFRDNVAVLDSSHPFWNITGNECLSIRISNCLDESSIELLKNLQQLKYLIFENLSIGDIKSLLNESIDLKTLCSRAHFKNLERLIFFNCGLTSKEMDDLSRFIRIDCPNLQTLSLLSNRIDSSGVDYLHEQVSRKF
ncbi:MAG: hypothetical protein MHMPM18_004089, partial [Marteilia pararefringens]